MVFHLHTLNGFAAGLLHSQCTHFSEMVDSISLSLPQMGSEQGKVLYALTRLFSVWEDDTLLIAFKPVMVENASELPTIDPRAVFLMVRLTGGNECTSRTPHMYRLSIQLVHWTHTDTRVTLVRSFGFRLTNNDIPSYIFPLMTNVLKWWHGKIMFVDAGQAGPMLRLLYTKYITTYTAAVLSHFDTYFSRAFLEESFVQLLHRCTANMTDMADVMRHIQYNSFTKQSIEGPDVKAFKIAISSERHRRYQCTHLLYQNTTTIHLILSFLRNNCIIQAAVHHVKSAAEGASNVIADSATAVNVLTINSHYYDDLIIADAI